MKFKTTTKSIKNFSHNIRSAGYCEIQNLLHGHEPIAYTCGTYGWNYDVYSIGSTAICTGYRPIGRRIGVDRYEAEAKAINENKDMTWEEKEEAVDELLYKFIKEE